ncbi:MAG TPA: insulinase family protein [bacterium]|nr:insulinase family protein [bacterium]
MKRWVQILIILILFVRCAARHPALPQRSLPENPAGTMALEDVLPVDPEVRTGTLENGLRYLIRKNTHPENRAELRLAVNAGSVLETDAQQGLAHFVEHMAFKGTTHFEKQEIVHYLESIGMRFGPDINAYTGFDETVYLLEVPTDSLDYLEKAFLILSDWAHGITFDPDEIDRERGVIIEEWRIGRGAAARMFDKQLPVLFQDSRYAERLPIGKMEIVERCGPETLREFYDTWYRPDLMAVVAVGDFEVRHIEDLIQIYFSAIPKPGRPADRPDFPVPDHKETRFAIATDPEAMRTRVSVYFKKPLPSEQTVGDYRRMLIENLYDAMFNERLIERLREADPPFLYGLAGSGRFVRSKGVYSISAGVDEGGVLRGLEAILIEAERVKRHGFTPSEFDRTRRDMLRGMEQAVRERDKTQSGRFASEYVRHFLVDEPISGIDFEYGLTLRFMPEIRLDEVNALASETVSDSNRVVLVSAPEKEDVPVPPEEALLGVFERVKEMDILPYEDEVSDAPLVRRLPDPGRIVHESEIESLGITEWRLSNGVRVILKPTTFRNDEILFDAFSPGGTSLAPDSLYVTASMAAQLVRGSGFGPFTETALNKRLAGKVVRASPVIGGLSEGISGSASPRDIRTLFELIYLQFTEPRADSTAFLSLRNRLLGVLRNRSASPEAAFSDTVAITLARGHFRARPWSEALLEEIDLEEARRFYADRFADAGDFTFVFVGNLKPDTLRPLIETYLGGLPSFGRDETWRDHGIVPPEGRIEKILQRGLEPRARVRMVFAGEATYSRQDAYDLDATLDFLRIHLREVLREDLGGTYGVGVSGSLVRLPRERYEVTVSFGCDPVRVDELTETVLATLDSLASAGPSPVSLRKVQEAQRRAYETRLKENRFWLGALYRAYYFGDDPARVLAYPELVDGLSGEAVRNAVRTRFDPENLIRFVLLPAEGDLPDQSP